MVIATGPTPAARRKIAIFVSFSGDGGVERVIVNLCQEFISQGFVVDLVLVKARGRHVEHIPKEVNVIKLPSSHTFSSIWSLARYLKSCDARSLLVAKHRAIISAILARRLARSKIRLVGQLHTHLSSSLQHKHPIRQWTWKLTMRLFYRHLDRIVTVSKGVGDDIQQITGIDPALLTTIYNPIVTPGLLAASCAPVEHPWFGGDIPVILGVGRFSQQKEFSTLIKAFALLRAQRDCRLMLLGDGEDLPGCKKIAQQLDILHEVSFVGFTSNPFAYMRQASLLAVSSRWEGFCNVLVEAMALGLPVVSTDCQSGPREILDDGRYGKLVPVGDERALADAMAATLDGPPAASDLIAAAARFESAKIAQQYLSLLLDE